MAQEIVSRHKHNMLSLLYATCLKLLVFGKASHHSGLSASLQPRFGSLRLLAFPKAKIALEIEEICQCEGQTVHRLRQRLTADWLAPQESDCSRMHSKVSSDWLPSYIKATRLVLEIFKTAGYFPDIPRTLIFNKISLMDGQKVLFESRAYSAVLK